jgi:hypothetical protein
MAYDECPESRTQPEKYKTVFVFFVGIVYENCAIVVEDGFRLLERNAVLSGIRGVLTLIPFETQLSQECRV